MGEVINIWSWRKPDRPPSKRVERAAVESRNVPSSGVASPIEGYTRCFFQRVKEGMSTIANPFWVTVDTTNPRVEMPEWLRASYHQKIQLVIQNKWDKLELYAGGFSIRLYFSGVAADLFVPFGAILQLIDQRASIVLDRSIMKEPWSG